SLNTADPFAPPPSAVDLDDEFAGVPRAGPGVGGWDDFGSVSVAAREALREAAGIKISVGRVVVWGRARSFFVFAPLNWGFFRLLRRVEWAWIAAPLIAIAGAIAVVRAAQLDIGFVRASNEVAVIEVQADYRRAHVTRYTALYTSLSTGYDVRMDDP